MFDKINIKLYLDIWLIWDNFNQEFVSKDIERKL